MEILLAFIWAAVTGHFTLSNVAVGMIVGYAVLFVAQPLMGRFQLFHAHPPCAWFCGFLHVADDHLQLFGSPMMY